MNKRLLLPVVVAVMCSVNVVAAESESKFYVGMQVGNTSVAGVEVPEDTSFKFDVGYRLNNTWAFDLGYSRLAGDNSGGTLNGLTLGGIVSTEGLIGNLDVNLSYGFIFWSINQKDSFTRCYRHARYNIRGTCRSYDTTSRVDSGTDYYLGLGLNYDLGTFEITGDYDRYFIEELEVDVISLGLNYKF